jgi:hypothetical protein
MITPGELGDVGGAAATTKNVQSLCRGGSPMRRLTEREVERLIEAALDGAGTRLPRGAFRRGGDDRMRDGMSAFGTKRTSESIHQCPLLGVKRTSARRSGMSAFDPKRTSAVIVSHRHFTAPHASIRGEPGFRHFDLDKFKIIAHNLLSTTD